MELDRKIHYRALKSRDARFDGRFFTGVRTTGIYCRPVCPARTPKLENIEFYACAAAAEEAGFRPCLRCRPETSPGTPAWSGTSTTVSRALRLIGEGAMDDEGVDELATRLGVGSRHLRRLFDEHLGASPVAVAQSRRVLFAKKLISETSLSLTDIAFASGYSSIRRFNAAFRKSYRMSPREIRRNGSGGEATRSNSGLELKLAYRPPYDWQTLIDFYKMRATPGVEAIEDGRYRRTVQLGGQQGIIEVSPAKKGDALILHVPNELSKSLPAIVERVRRIFDLKADPHQIESILGQDKRLAPLILRNPGLRVPGTWEGFEITVRAILGQQVSVKGATTLCTRLAKKYGEPLASGPSGTLTHLFPTPERLSRAHMSGLGITGARIATIRAIAKAVIADDTLLDTAPSLDQATESLTQIPGIGPWTAHYIAMRALGEPDAFPSGDLGLQKACANAKGEKLNEKALLRRAESWRPWRAYAAMHLWRSLSYNGKASGG